MKTASTNGGTMLHITKHEMESTPIALPGLEEQSAIGTTINDMNCEITSLEAKRAKARELKQGMMQELLTGRIRLL
jgi:type I restriction enzyme S subunit